MKFGLFSNSGRNRVGRPAWESYAADLEEIVAGDRLGMEEVWISEHLGAPHPNHLPTPELLIAQASSLTERIRMGCGVRLLPLHHPFDVATQASVNDHLTRGRYNFGFGQGFPGARNMERIGLDPGEQLARTLESLDFILRCWTSEEPFDFDGDFYTGRDVKLVARPYQDPHPPLGMAADHSLSEMGGERGYSFLLGHWDTPEKVAERMAPYLAAAESAGVESPRDLIKVARVVYVAEDDATAAREVRDGVMRDLDWRRDFNPKSFPTGYLRDGETIDDATFELLHERGCIIAGDPDTVVERLVELDESLGGVGTVLVVAGKDFGPTEGRMRSYELLMQEVAPRLAVAPRSAA